MSIPPNIPPPPANLPPNLEIDVQQPDVQIEVDQQPDVQIEVDQQPDLNLTVETVIDVDENANLLTELEAALLKDAGINVRIDDKRRVLDVSAHLEKEGTDAKSPIVAYTYQTKKMKRVYDPATKKMVDKEVDVTCWKFKTTWDMKVLNPDGTTKTVTRTAWMKTPVEVPKSMKDPADMTHSQYLALLHVKAVRHTYKAALNPGHYHHQRTQETIKYLRETNNLHISFKPDPQQWHQQLINLQKGKMAYYAVIRLHDAEEKSRSLEIDYYKTATKVDDAGKKWVPSPSNIHSKAYNVARKHREQRIVARDERLDNFTKLQNAPADQFLQQFQDYQASCRTNPTFALITAQNYRELTKKESEKKKEEFDLTASQLATQFTGHPALQMVEALTGLVPNAVIKMNIEEKMEKINEDLTEYNAETTDPNMKQMMGNSLVSEMQDLCKAAKNLETIKDDIIKKEIN